MKTTAERLTSRSATVFVAMDSFDPLVERIVGIVRGDTEAGGTPASGRLMTVMRSYPNQPGHTSVHTSLCLDPEARSGGIAVQSYADPVGRSLHFDLRPGIHGFGFSCYAREAETEAQVAKRFHANRQDVRNLTVVRFDGWAGQPCREDTITIEHWNDHGVLMRTEVFFEAEPWERRQTGHA